ncbi:AraC family transcriptional regulator [Roseateles sp.]|uniref:AraC family transcriptional regulator n=1 Tax=Roseateles sp. TaxID=1971397 RepID=UPI003266D2F6
MTANASRRQYEARMHRVQAHIDLHLDQPLDLQALAAVAHFSPFHFHRLFLAWTGRTLGDYLARRRLEKGAQRLRGQPASSVLSIALGVGYGSAEAFTRAFKQRFGLPPTQWRNLDQVDSNLDQAGAGQGGEHGFSHHRDEGDPVNIRLIDRPPVRMGYLRYQGAYGPALGRFWAETFTPWLATQNPGGCRAWGRVRAGASCGARLGADEAWGGPPQRVGNAESPRKSHRPFGLGLQGG